MQILIVDDDRVYCAELEGLLSHYGYDCLCVYDGTSALDTIREFGKPDVILLDLGLPDMHGMEFRRQQLADPEIAGIPVVVISGQHLPGHWRHQLLAEEYFSKPFAVGDLLDVLSLIVGR